jgi:carbonic anhydrase
MKKLIRGIVEFREKKRPGYRDTFAALALGQKPDALFIACSDSRVAANVFASTDPGDLFVVRNVGNLIPPCGPQGHSEGDESEAAAIEFSTLTLGVRHIIICGHSECGAMQAVCDGRDKVVAPHLRSWLRHALPAYEKLGGKNDPNRLSRINVVQQLENLKTYPLIRERVERGELALHGLWFDIRNAEVNWYERSRGEFVPIDAALAATILGEKA